MRGPALEGWQSIGFGLDAFWGRRILLEAQGGFRVDSKPLLHGSLQAYGATKSPSEWLGLGLWLG